MLTERTSAFIPIVDRYAEINEDTESRIEDAIDLLDKLTCTELKRIKEYFDQKYEQVRRKDSNYILHDFVDDYIYVVYFDDGTVSQYCKGQNAYSMYKNFGVRLERKTKDLFPKYEKLMEKKPTADLYRKNEMPKKEQNKMEKAKYDMEYQKQNIKQIKFTLNKNTDQDIILHLEKIPNRNGYLKSLIRSDMKSRN